MVDKRRNRRFVVDDMDIQGKMVCASEVKVVNISASGVSIKADRRLDMGTEYTLKIEDRDSRALSLRGVVMWSNISGSRPGSRDIQIPLYSAGLRFKDLQNDRLAELLDFIELHKTDPEHRVTGLRFRIDNADRAVMGFPCAYRVKRLSLSGMLIESAGPLAIEERYPMEISLPDEKPVRFAGKVSSCRLVSDKGSEQYHIGISFVSMPEKDAERLRGFIVMLRNLNQGRTG